MEQCKTKRPEKLCPEMIEGVCSLRNTFHGECHEVVKECIDNKCPEIEEFGEKKFCKLYYWPHLKWRMGATCPSIYYKVHGIGGASKHKLNPLKKSKRNRGR